MVQQTRSALIYSDLALFVVDSRDGIKGDDKFLSRWLQTRMKLTKNLNLDTENIPRTLEQRRQEFQKIVEEGKELIPGSNLQKMSKTKLNKKFKELEYKGKQIKDLLLAENEDDVKVPKLLLIANKAEDGFKGNIEKNSDTLNIGNLIFVSGEHGDGLVNLIQAINSELPENYKRS